MEMYAIFCSLRFPSVVNNPVLFICVTDIARPPPSQAENSDSDPEGDEEGEKNER